jgi:predicted RNA-binding Zn-ribbon protein involved in translation (DUF1610 family)
MKICAYCGRENRDDAANCSGCGEDKFQSDTPAQDPLADDVDDLVTLAKCAKLEDADLIVSLLEGAGIQAFIPDEQLTQTFGFNLNSSGGVRVQVRPQDYAIAKELLPTPEAKPANSQPSVPGNKKVIASLAMGQLLDIMERLKKQAIPAEMRTVTQASGVEINEILVEEGDFDRGCDVVEAWDAEQQAAAKSRSKVRCDQCGSQNYERIPHDKLGHVYRCKDCGTEFV